MEEERKKIAFIIEKLYLSWPMYCIIYHVKVISICKRLAKRLIARLASRPCRYAVRRQTGIAVHVCRLTDEGSKGFLVKKE